MMVFVYGTLKRDGRLNYAMGDSEFRGEACSADATYTMRSVGGSFPVLSNGGSCCVVGELFDVSCSKVLQELDHIEVAYDRYLRWFLRDDGVWVMAWVYIGKRVDWEPDGLPLVKPQGDLLVWKNRR